MRFNKVFTKSLCVVFTVCVATMIGFGQSETSVSAAYLDISKFGSPGVHKSVSFPKLSKSEAEEFSALVKRLPKFPKYLYSGCHDRAHAVYLMLPVPLREKVGKVWIMAPSKFTAAIGGSIGINGDQSGNYPGLKWGYHVAIAFEGSNGLVVFDPVVDADKTLTLKQWFEKFRIPEFSFWTKTNGSTYLFFATTTDGYSVNRNIWSGNSFTYSGTSLQEHWIPKALARDAVGERIINGNGCADLSGLVQRPDDLLNKLQEDSPGIKCRDDYELFKSQLENWKRLIEFGI